MLTKELPNNEKLLIEVISSVNGLTREELSDPDVLELRPGHVYRVPSPVTLLKAKLANVAKIDQTRRQDVRHVQMLIPCVCEYLREYWHVRALAGKISERQLTNLLENARDLSSDPSNKTFGEKHNFELAKIFPPKNPSF